MSSTTKVPDSFKLNPVTITSIADLQAMKAKEDAEKAEKAGGAAKQPKKPDEATLKPDDDAHKKETDTQAKSTAEAAVVMKPDDSQPKAMEAEPTAGQPTLGGPDADNKTTSDAMAADEETETEDGQDELLDQPLPDSMTVLDALELELAVSTAERKGAFLQTFDPILASNIKEATKSVKALNKKVDAIEANNEKLEKENKDLKALNAKLTNDMAAYMSKKDEELTKKNKEIEELAGNIKAANEAAVAHCAAFTKAQEDLASLHTTVASHNKNIQLLDAAYAKKHSDLLKAISEDDQETYKKNFLDGAMKKVEEACPDSIGKTIVEFMSSTAHMMPLLTELFKELDPKTRSTILAILATSVAQKDQNLDQHLAKAVEEHVKGKVDAPFIYGSAAFDTAVKEGFAAANPNYTAIATAQVKNDLKNLNYTDIMKQVVGDDYAAKTKDHGPSQILQDIAKADYTSKAKRAVPSKMLQDIAKADYEAKTKDHGPSEILQEIAQADYEAKTKDHDPIRMLTCFAQSKFQEETSKVSCMELVQKEAKEAVSTLANPALPQPTRRSGRGGTLPTSNKRQREEDDNEEAPMAKKAMKEILDKKIKSLGLDAKVKTLETTLNREVEKMGKDLQTMDGRVAKLEHKFLTLGAVMTNEDEGTPKTKATKGTKKQKTPKAAASAAGGNTN